MIPTKELKDFNFLKKTKKKSNTAYITLGIVVLLVVNIAGLLSYPRNSFIKKFYDPPLPINDYQYQNYLKSHIETSLYALTYIEILQSQKNITPKETIRKIQELSLNKINMNLNIQNKSLTLINQTSYSRLDHENNKYLIKFDKNPILYILNIEDKNVENFKKQTLNRTDLIFSEKIIKDEYNKEVRSLMVEITLKS